MTAATPAAFERYALYALAILVVALYAWGVARTIGGGPGEGHAARDRAAPPTVAAAPAPRPPLVRVDYRVEGGPRESLGGAQLHRSNLPQDLARLAAVSERKRAFIERMMPLVARVNEHLLEQRRRLLAIEQKRLVGLAPAPDEARWLARLGAEYGIEEIDLAALKARVDAVPPSLALAQAAEESGWGTSRFAVEGNALFGQRVYRGKGGIVPLRRNAGERFRIRAFDDLQESVGRYMHNLNTHWAYEEFRGLRAATRAAGRPLDGLALAAGLARYSERGADYIKTIRSIISYNGLTALDRAGLYGARGSIPTPGA